MPGIISFSDQLLAKGIVAATWAIIALVMSCSRLYRPRSVFFFYHFIIDIMVLAALISAAVLATPNAPNTIAQCVRMNTLRYSHRPLLFRYLGRIKSETSLSACERLLTIRILAIVSMCVYPGHNLLFSNTDLW